MNFVNFCGKEKIIVIGREKAQKDTRGHKKIEKFVNYVHFCGKEKIIVIGREKAQKAQKDDIEDTLMK